MSHNHFLFFNPLIFNDYQLFNYMSFNFKFPSLFGKIHYQLIVKYNKDTFNLVIYHLMIDLLNLSLLFNKIIKFILHK